jgi:hypothetical protein
MTSTHSETIIIQYCGPESLTTAKGRTVAEGLIKTMKEIEPPGPAATYNIGPDCIETSASAALAGELLDRSGLNREDKSEWYLADADPAGSSLPEVKFS